jgi:mannose-6-phosphate isomerase-like protein (cupin superfamily)
MNREQDKALAISLTGPQRDQVLEKFHQQIREWNLALPPVEPLVLDFGLGDFYRQGLIEYWIANEITAGYCAKYLFVFNGQTCPIHWHRQKHETFFVVKGMVQVTRGQVLQEMKPGDVLPIACGQRHGFSGVGPALLLEVSMPCIVADNFFEDPQILVPQE